MNTITKLLIGKTFFKHFSHLLHSKTIHLICRRVIVPIGSHWIRSEIINTNIYQSRKSYLTSQSTSINSNFGSILIEIQTEIKIPILRKRKVKLKFIFQNFKNFHFSKKYFLSYTFHARISFKLKFNFKFNIKLRFKYKVVSSNETKGSPYFWSDL